MTFRVVPDPAAVAAWRRAIVADVRCVKAEPDPADPYDVAAYNEALRQLEAEAQAQL